MTVDQPDHPVVDLLDSVSASQEHLQPPRPRCTLGCVPLPVSLSRASGPQLLCSTVERAAAGLRRCRDPAVRGVRDQVCRAETTEQDPGPIPGQTARSSDLRTCERLVRV